MKGLREESGEGETQCAADLKKREEKIQKQAQQHSGESEK